MTSPLITDDQFLNGFLWGRGVMESRQAIRCTVSTRPFPLLDNLEARARAVGLDVEIQEVGATDDGDGSLAMWFRSDDDWIFTELRDPIGARRIEPGYGTEFLQGFFASRCSMSGALICSWNRAASDLTDTLAALGVDHVVEHETVRIRRAATHEEFWAYLAARKEERQQLAALSTDVERHEQPEITEAGWLYWAELDEGEQQAYTALANLLIKGPATFNELRDRASELFENEVRFRVVIGRALKTTDLPVEAPKIHRVYPWILEQAYKDRGRQFPSGGFTPIYTVRPTHGPGVDVMAIVFANRDAVGPPGDTDLWDAMAKHAPGVYTKEEAESIDWDAIQRFWSHHWGEDADWSLFLRVVPTMAPKARSQEHRRWLYDFAAPLLNELGTVGEAGFEVKTRRRTPFVHRLLQWIEAQAGIPASLRVTQATDGSSYVEGQLPIPTRMYDVLRLGSDAMDRNPHYQEGMKYRWILDEYQVELPPPYSAIMEEEIQRPSRRKTTARKPPKWLKGGTDDHKE